MNTAFHTGAAGLKAHQTNIDIIGHNITNSATAGYKSTVPEFRELVYTNMDANKNRELAEDEKIKAGHGVMVNDDTLNFTQGSLRPTDYALDFAISGDGFFAVMSDDQTVEYTRNGSFDISVEGNAAYLVNSDGEYVLNNALQRIQLGYDAGSRVLNIDNVKGQLGIFSFDNPNGLIRTDGGSFLPSDNSGQPAVAAATDYYLHQSTLERSNVQLSQEMTDLIVAQKAYQFSARVVTTADEIEQLINSLRN